VVRSQGDVVRITKGVRVPFGGINSHDDPRSVPIYAALQAQNVILLYGRIKVREGFKAWNGDWQQVFTPYNGGQIEGLFSWLARDFNESTIAFRSFGVLKLAIDPAYTLGAFRVWNRDFATPDFGWNVPINDKTDSEILTTDVVNFQKVGQAAKLLAGNNMPEYDTTVFMLDRSARAHKTNGVGTTADVATPGTSSAARVVRVGLSKPSVVQSTWATASNGAGNNHPQGTYEYVVSVANEALNPNEEYGVIGSDPGLESNSVPTAVPYFDGASGVQIGVGVSEKLTFNITCPDYELEPWTCIRLYRRRVSGVEETTFRHVHTVGRTGLSGYTFTVDTEVSGLHTFDVGSSATDASMAAAGPFAFAPLRNSPPQFMSHFAKFSGRGWYARSYENKLYYSDIEDTLSGGNIESISNEFIGPFNGPITMLAQYFNSLLIGTPTSLSVLTGTYRSKTNQDVWTGNTIQNTGYTLDEMEIDRGPVLYGVGNTVEADQILYFVSREGLEAYNGRVAISVSRPVFEDLKTFATDSGGTIQEIMRKSQLAHDPVRNIIYMLVRRDIQYTDEVISSTSPFDGTDATYVKSRIYCYHYRESDPENNQLGRWTVFDQIGPGALDKTLTAVNDDRRDRYSSIAMRSYESQPPNLCLGHRAPTTEGDDTPGDPVDYDYLSYRHAVVMEQDQATFADSHFDGKGGGITDGRSYRWQSGKETFGMLDLFKRFWFLKAQVASSSASETSLDVGFSVDDGTETFVSINPATLVNPEIQIGWTGRQLSVIFRGEDSSDDTEITGFAVDMEPIG